MDYSKLTKNELLSIIKELENNDINRSRDLFISNISHDVRTLLNAIYGNAQILDNDETLNLIQKKSVTRIIEASSNMIELINNIINISTNLGNDKIVLSQFNLHEFLNSIFLTFNTIAQSKNILLEVNSTISIDYIIKSDKNKLFYILLNLVGNALKFTKEGKISIVCEYLDSKNEILFNIVDTGTGIDSNMITEITKDYVRTKNSNNIEGNGLGLGIVQQNLSLLGSSLHIKSVLNKGSEFSFKIKSVENNINFETTKDNIFEMMNILRIIEPNDFKVLVFSTNTSEVDVLDTYFNNRNIKYEIASDLDKFKSLIDLKNYNIVFIELSKLNLKDFDFFKECKNKSKDSIFVVLSSSVMNEDLKKINEISTTYLLKPYSFIDIDQVLIMFSSQKFIYEEKVLDEVNDILITCAYKDSIILEAKIGNYKSCSKLINKIEDIQTKKLLIKYLDNYDFDEIIAILEKA